jgi:hypothetical protein
MKNVINGDVFIIPNDLCRVSDFLPCSQEHVIENLKNFGFNEIDESTLLVQVWATGPEVDNWSCHGWLPEFLDNEEINSIGELSIERFPDYLPVSLFIGMKEGDNVMINTKPEESLKKGLKITLKLAQLKYRYRNWGPFEKVLQQKLAGM